MKIYLLLKDGIYAVTNIGLLTLMYIQIIILLKAALFLEGLQRSVFRIYFKQDRYFDKTNKKSGKLLQLAFERDT